MIITPFLPLLQPLHSLILLVFDLILPVLLLRLKSRIQFDLLRKSVLLTLLAN